MILFDGLPVPTKLFLFMCTCFPCIHVSLYIDLDTLFTVYSQVRRRERVGISTDGYSNLLILLFFENIIL